MPSYDYLCRHCGHAFEARQRISEPPLRWCDRCEELALERQIAPATFVLKGGGWYADGYRSTAGAARSSGAES